MNANPKPGHRREPTNVAINDKSIRRPFFSDAEIRAAFQTLDVDGNGFVSSTELRAVMEACGKDVTDEEIDQMMKVVDTDGDGQLSLSEFMIMVKRDIMGLEIVQDDIQVAAGGLKADEPAKESTIDRMKNRIKKQGEVFEFVSSRVLDILQLEDLYFQKIQRLPSRMISYNQFCKIFRCRETKLSENVFTVYGNDKNANVDARILVMALAAVLPINQIKKAKFSFRLFDEDQSGSIRKESLFDILKANHLTSLPDEVEKKADLIITAASTQDDTDKITFDNFVAVIKKFPNIVFPPFKVQQ